MFYFAKAHACGNDFLIVEQNPAWSDLQEHDLALALCARNTGVGADGVEFLHWTGERAGSIRLRNADGGIAEISGNGTRCVAAWVAHERGAQPGDTIELLTDAGPRTCTLVTREGHRMQIQSGMGTPTARQAAVTIDATPRPVEGAIVSTGNPHFVIRVDTPDFTVQGLDWETVGRAICFHPDFPQQTNVEFLRVLSAREIEIRIFERGVGPTSSSGTGTCATATAAIAFHGCDRDLTVHAPGGPQRVRWAGDGSEMELTGPAEIVCSGSVYVETAPAETASRKAAS